MAALNLQALTVYHLPYMRLYQLFIVTITLHNEQSQNRWLKPLSIHFAHTSVG